MAVNATNVSTPAPARPADNREQLVRISVAGRVADGWLDEAASYDAEGRLRVLPATGGVALRVHAGDIVGSTSADHLLPGASIQDAETPITSPGALHLFACIGNRVRTTAGASLGVVAAKRGGFTPHAHPHLLGVETPDSRAGDVAPGLPVVLESYGRGLQLVGWPDVALLNMDPAILDAIPLTVEGARLVVPVRAVVPSALAGAGLGQDSWDGDLDISGYPSCLPADLRFGDLVAFDDIDARFSRYCNPGFVAIGLVAHGPSHEPGHGVGITILMSGSRDRLGVRIDPAASLSTALRAMSAAI